LLALQKSKDHSKSSQLLSYDIGAGKVITFLRSIIMVLVPENLQQEIIPNKWVC